MKLEPIGKKILVLPLETREDSIGGIIIPAGVNEANLRRGRVVEVSSDLSKKFSIGDVVYYSKDAGYGQRYNGEFCLWLSEREFDSDIWGIETGC